MLSIKLAVIAIWLLLYGYFCSTTVNPEQPAWWYAVAVILTSFCMVSSTLLIMASAYIAASRNS